MVSLFKFELVLTTLWSLLYLDLVALFLRSKSNQKWEYTKNDVIILEKKIMRSKFQDLNFGDIVNCVNHLYG